MRNKVVRCILGGSIKPVIPEVAKRLSGIQRNISLLDTGSRLRLVRYDDCFQL